MKLFGSTGRKRFVGDVTLNIFASLLSTALLKLLIEPYLSRTMSADAYGQVLLLIGFCNIFAAVFGNCLNNVRLITDTAYKKKKIIGDFNFLFLILAVLNVVCVYIALYFFNDADTSSFGGIAIISLLGMFKAYYSVEYRLLINFKKILLQTIFYCIGGIIGFLIYLNFNTSWMVTYILAESAACIYTLFTTSLLKESFKITELFKSTTTKYALLMLTGFMNSVIAYLDRIFLYPVLGGAEVAIYSTAAFFGKSLSIVMTPMSGVILSYYAKQDIIKRSTFLKQTGMILLASGIFYALSLTGIATWITDSLYPTLITEAQPYIWIANLSSIILISCTLIQPAILKYADTKYQPIIQGIHIFLYFTLGGLFARAWGLFGFCVAALLANIIKFLMLFFVGLFTLSRRNSTLSQ